MLSFTFLFLCIQACLVQNVFSQCIAPAIAAPCAETLGAPYGAFAEPFAAGAYGLAGPFTAPLTTGPVGVYGGAGIGEVAVDGELPVAGITLVAGQIPILGAVEVGGPVCAAGTVTMTGSCACGSAGPYGAGYIY